VLIYNHSLQPTIHNDNVNQIKVGLESDKGYFSLKVKTMTLMSQFFCPQYYIKLFTTIIYNNNNNNNNVYLPNSSGRTNYRAKMTKKMTLVIIIHETKLMLNDIHPNFYLQNRS
jgi:hypothetical protein